MVTIEEAHPVVADAEKSIELQFEISANSFYQVNHDQMEKLYAIVRRYCKEAWGDRDNGNGADGPVVLDLYCGIGTIGLCVADMASHVHGIEIVKDAVTDANRNAVINGIVNATYICGKAEELGTNHANGLDIRPEEFEEFDFIIAGFHYGCFNCSSVKNWLWAHGFKAGEESLRKSNTKMVTDALRKNDIAILTHPGDKGPFDIPEIARVCAETGTLIEINGRHGHLTTEEIKEAMKVEGLQFVISSDAHTPDAVGSFRTALQRALDAGLDVSRIVNIRLKEAE